MSIADFTHQMAAHCESGALQALLGHAGLSISEPMIFGIGSGVFFGYFTSPLLAFPTFAMRNRPGQIWANVASRTGFALSSRTFRSPEKAEAALDALLAQGIPAAVQVDFFHMDYVPRFARAHFNAHFIVVVGREGDEYVVSDSYAPALARLSVRSMRLARSARGQFAPAGRLIHLTGTPGGYNQTKAILKGIQQAASYMLRIPLPILGVRGIRWFARKVQGWPALARDEAHLAHELMSIPIIIEDRGTGGGGFRFLYASFLQEAAMVLERPELNAIAREVMEDGDRWRELALFVARACKADELGTATFSEIASLLEARADAEHAIFRRLLRAA